MKLVLLRRKFSFT